MCFDRYASGKNLLLRCGELINPRSWLFTTVCIVLCHLYQSNLLNNFIVWSNFPSHCWRALVCIGGGVDFITAADIRLCTKDAQFSVRETKIAMGMFSVVLSSCVMHLDTPNTVASCRSWNYTEVMQISAQRICQRNGTVFIRSNSCAVLNTCIILDLLGRACFCWTSAALWLGKRSIRR